MPGDKRCERHPLYMEPCIMCVQPSQVDRPVPRDEHEYLTRVADEAIAAITVLREEALDNLARYLRAPSPPAQQEAPLLREMYWCGCVRHARWERCEAHGDLDHDEQPPRQEGSAPITPADEWKPAPEAAIASTARQSTMADPEAGDIPAGAWTPLDPHQAKAFPATADVMERVHRRLVGERSGFDPDFHDLSKRVRGLIEEVLARRRTPVAPVGTPPLDLEAVMKLTDVLARTASGAMFAAVAEATVPNPDPYSEKRRAQQNEFDEALAKIRDAIRALLHESGTSGAPGLRDSGEREAGLARWLYEYWCSAKGEGAREDMPGPNSQFRHDAREVIAFVLRGDTGGLT